MSKDLEMYTQDDCIFCLKAKETIKNNPDMGFKVTEYNIQKHPSYKDTLLERQPAAKTVPQIWIAGKYIGGYEDLEDYIMETTSIG
jgi:glutaredoxin|tara:strand:- start:1653 stop:1910 length:258 start_codon:yes stop_codon:yes gene_type:complete